jgi:hypothetical protein
MWSSGRCHPVLDGRTNPLAVDARTRDFPDSGGRPLVRVNDDYVRWAGRFESAARRLQTALKLVVEATSENELRMQVSGRQRVAKKDERPRSAEDARAVIPEALEDRTFEVFQVRGRDQERVVALSNFGPDWARRPEGLNAFARPLVVKDSDSLALGDVLDVAGVVPIQRSVRLQQ